MSKPQTKRLSIQNFAILIAVFLVIGVMLGPNINQVYTGISATGSDTVELTNDGNLDTKVRDFSITPIGVYTVVVDDSGTTNEFAKRQIIHMDSSVDGVLTDYQLDETIPYQSGMQSDMDDISFTELDGTYIPHLTKGVTTGVSANVLFKTSVPASGGKDVWMYFENGDVGDLSDGGGTFDFYSGFSSFDSGILGGTYESVTDGVVKLTDDTLTSVNSFGINTIFEARIKTVNVVGGYAMFGYNVHTDAEHATSQINSDTYTWITRNAKTGAETSVTRDVLDSTYRDYVITRRGSTDILYSDGSNEYTIATNIPTGDITVKLFSSAEGVELYCDKVSIRKCTPNPPTVTMGVIESPDVTDPSLTVGEDVIYYDGSITSTLVYSDGSAYIDSSSVSPSMKGELPIIKVGTTQNIKIDHDLEYSITYIPKNMDVASPDMFRAGDDMRVDTRLTDTSGNPTSYQPLEMRIRLFDSNDKLYLDEIVSSTSFVIPGKYLHDNKHYQLRLSYEGYEFGGWSNEILADFDIGTEGFIITSSPDKAPEGVMAASFAAVEGLVGMAVTGWLDVPIIGDIIRFIANLLGVEL